MNIGSIANPVPMSKGVTGSGIWLTFTKSHSPVYESPIQAELELDTSALSVDDFANRVLRLPSGPTA
jgi:hypothetical protein